MCVVFLLRWSLSWGRKPEKMSEKKSLKNPKREERRSPQRRSKTFFVSLSTRSYECAFSFNYIVVKWLNFSDSFVGVSTTLCSCDDEQLCCVDRSGVSRMLSRNDVNKPVKTRKKVKGFDCVRLECSELSDDEESLIAFNWSITRWSDAECRAPRCSCAIKVSTMSPTARSPLFVVFSTRLNV